ncbi:MAG: GlxA family transcriptional regulator [Parvibaculaceae bacterium]
MSMSVNLQTKSAQAAAARHDHANDCAATFEAPLAALAMPVSPKLRVGILLWPEFTMLAFSGFVDALRLAADIGDRSRQKFCRWDVMAESPEAIAASCGVKVSPTCRFADPRQFDYVVVVAGLLHRIHDSPPGAAEYIRNAAECRVPLIGICTGSFVLAGLGLLDGRRTCPGHYHYKEFSERFPRVPLVYDQLYCVDGDRITCSGGAASIDLAGYLVGRHCGVDRAAKVSHMVIVDRLRGCNSPQRVLHGEDQQVADHRVSRSIGLMEQHMAEPIPIGSIAAQVGISERQLERVFLAFADRSPANYYRLIRLRYGNWLLGNTDASITQIALSCGFSDSAHFTRCFRKEFGRTPSRYRPAADSQRQEDHDRSGSEYATLCQPLEMSG